MVKVAEWRIVPSILLPQERFLRRSQGTILTESHVCKGEVRSLLLHSSDLVSRVYPIERRHGFREGIVNPGLTRNVKDLVFSGKIR